MVDTELKNCLSQSRENLDHPDACSWFHLDSTVGGPKSPKRLIRLKPAMAPRKRTLLLLHPSLLPLQLSISMINTSSCESITDKCFPCMIFPEESVLKENPNRCFLTYVRAEEREVKDVACWKCRLFLSTYFLCNFIQFFLHIILLKYTEVKYSILLVDYFESFLDYSNARVRNLERKIMISNPLWPHLVFWYKCYPVRYKGCVKLQTSLMKKLVLKVLLIMPTANKIFNKIYYLGLYFGGCKFYALIHLNLISSSFGFSRLSCDSVFAVFGLLSLVSSIVVFVFGLLSLCWYVFDGVFVVFFGSSSSAETPLILIFPLLPLLLLFSPRLVFVFPFLYLIEDIKFW